MTYTIADAYVRPQFKFLKMRYGGGDDEGILVIRRDYEYEAG